MYRTTRSTITAAAAVLAVISLGACGSSDDTGSGPDATVTATSQTTESGSPATTTSSPTAAVADGGSSQGASSEDASSAGASSGAAATKPGSTAPSDAGSDDGPSESGTVPPDEASPTTGKPSDPAIPPANRLGHKTSRASFVSPSGKIACTYYAMGTNELARCDLRSGSLHVPQKLKDACEFDMGGSLIVDMKGARPNCVSDAVEADSSSEAQESRWWTPKLGASANDEAILPYNHSVGISETRCESRSTGMTCRVGEHGFKLNDTTYTTW